MGCAGRWDGVPPSTGGKARSMVRKAYTRIDESKGRISVATETRPSLTDARKVLEAHLQTIAGGITQRLAQQKPAGQGHEDSVFSKAPHQERR